MNIEEIKNLQQLIKKTQVLSEDERLDWLDLISEMNDQQLVELKNILSTRKMRLDNLAISANAPVMPSAQQAPVRPLVQPAQPAIPQQHTAAQLKPQQPAAQPASRLMTSVSIGSAAPTRNQAQPQQPQVAPLPRRVAIDITEKELTTSRPMYELALPDPTPKPVPIPMPTPPPVENDARSIIARMQGKGRAADAVQVKQQPAAVEEGMPLPKFTSSADFAKLTPEMLHVPDPYVPLQDILNAVAEVSKKERFLIILNNLDNSPLYHAYVDYGFRELNWLAQKAAQSSSNQPMSKEQFEAFADFRRELDEILI